MKHEHGSAGFEAQPERYQKIEKLNHESFLMHELASTGCAVSA